MSGRKIGEELGMDMSMDEALSRFARATKEEIAKSGVVVSGVPNGELELIPFKNETIRRVCHDGEWWYRS